MDQNSVLGGNCIRAIRCLVENSLGSVLGASPAALRKRSAIPALSVQFRLDTNLNSCMSQASRTSIEPSPPSSRTTLTDQLPTDPKQNVSSWAPSSCLTRQHNQEASVPQKMEHKRKHLLKICINENKASMSLKRKHITFNNSLEEASKHTALEEDADEVEDSLHSGSSRAFKNHFCDTRYLDDLEKSQLIERLKQAVTLVVTLMYKDGSTQLRADQTPDSSVKGIVMLLLSPPEGGCGPPGASALGGALAGGLTARDCFIYVNTEHSCTWGREQEAQTEFARNVLLQLLTRKCPVICFNAKDFVRTVLQFFGDDGCWKRVADFVGLDPRIAAWLIDPSEAAPSFEDLVAKYLGNSVTAEASSAHGNASGDTVVSCSGFGSSASARPSRSPDTVRSAERLAAQGALRAFALLLQCKCFTFHPNISGRMWVRVGFSVPWRSYSQGILFTARPFKMDLGRRLAFSLSGEPLVYEFSVLVTWPPWQGAWAGHSHSSAPPLPPGRHCCEKQQSGDAQVPPHSRRPAGPAGPLTTLLGLSEVEYRGKLDWGSRPAVGCERREQGRWLWEPFVPQTVCVRGSLALRVRGACGKSGVVPGSEEKQNQTCKRGSSKDPGDRSPQARASMSHGFRVLCHCFHVCALEGRRGREVAVLPRSHTVPKQKLKSHP
ncbi:DNA polymerase nu [Pteropus alecto]|uniref:DNA polymerase nu n=1 Tax=Pteropus alecto TaxID=9402 RepID=L5K7V8_PTEAL|nr:DNA polymerase nu [Pteropus alecto]